MRHIGVSNFTVEHLRELRDESGEGIRGLVVQMEVNAWYWRDAMEIQQCFAEEGLHLVGYAVVGEGRLLREECPGVLRDIARRLEISLVQVVMIWILKKGWGVLVKSRDVERFSEEQLDSLTWSLNLHDFTTFVVMRLYLGNMAFFPNLTNGGFACRVSRSYCIIAAISVACGYNACA